MTDTAAARVAPPFEAQFTQQISALVSRPTRAYLLGSVEADQARGESIIVRHLLVKAIEGMALADPVEYARRVALGETEIERRETERAARIAATSQQE